MRRGEGLVVRCCFNALSSSIGSGPSSADGGSSVGVSRGTDRREKKARKREKREKRRRDAKDDDGDEIYRLRRERLEREGKEAERERALLARDERVVDRYHRSARGRR